MSRLSAQLLSLCLALPVFGQEQPAPPGTAEQSDLFKSSMWREMLGADRMAAAGDWTGAADTLLRLGTQAPVNLLLREKAALALEKAGRWQEALDQWTALSAAAARPDTLVRIGRCQMFLDLPDEAALSLSAAAALSPDDLEPRLLQSALRIRRNSTNEVASVLGVMPVGQMGTLLYWLSADAPLREEFLGPDKTTGLARWILGGGIAPAEAEAAGARPDAVSLRAAADALSRVEHSMQIRNLRRARLAAGASVRLGARGPFMEAYTAYLDMAAGRGAQAKAAMDRLLQAHPQEASLHFFLGVMLLEHEEFEPAIEPLRRASELSQHRPDIMFAHACALAGAARNEEAMLEIMSLARRHPDRTPGLIRQSAPALDALRQTPEFMDWYDEFIKAAPPSP